MSRQQVCSITLTSNIALSFPSHGNERITDLQEKQGRIYEYVLKTYKHKE